MCFTPFSKDFVDGLLIEITNLKQTHGNVPTQDLIEAIKRCDIHDEITVDVDERFVKKFLQYWGGNARRMLILVCTMLLQTII